SCPSDQRGALLLLSLEVFGEVAEDHFVERLVADQILSEDGAPLLGSSLSEDRRRSRRRVAAFARARRGRRRRSRRRLGVALGRPRRGGLRSIAWRRRAR